MTDIFADIKKKYDLLNNEFDYYLSISLKLDLAFELSEIINKLPYEKDKKLEKYLLDLNDYFNYLVENINDFDVKSKSLKFSRNKLVPIESYLYKYGYTKPMYIIYFLIGLFFDIIVYFLFFYKGFYLPFFTFIILTLRWIVILIKKKKGKIIIN